MVRNRLRPYAPEFLIGAMGGGGKVGVPPSVWGIFSGVTENVPREFTPGRARDKVSARPARACWVDAFYRASVPSITQPKEFPE